MWGQLKLCGLPFIRYYREGGGMLSETFLNTIGIDLQDRIEADQTDLILRLVAEGKGWTMTRASAVLSRNAMLDELEIVPLPEPLPRHLYLMDRSMLPINVHQLIVKETIGIFRESIVPKMLELMPWIEKDLVIGTEDNPKPTLTRGNPV